jgi:hypothetical protein
VCVRRSGSLRGCGRETQGVDGLVPSKAVAWVCTLARITRVMQTGGAGS